MVTFYFVNRVFFKKDTHVQSNSIQKYEEEIAARKRFYSILASDIDSDAYEYEMVQIVRGDGICIASQVFDRREEPVPEPEPEPTPEPTPDPVEEETPTEGE